MTAADALVFRVNRSVVVLNDAARGRVWVPTEDAELREPHWEAVEPEPEELEGEPDADTATDDRTPLADCTAQTVPPSAADDEFGVRPGRSTVLPVLDNDSASDCGTLVISQVDPLPAELGTLTPVAGSRALQLHARRRRDRLRHVHLHRDRRPRQLRAEHRDRARDRPAGRRQRAPGAGAPPHDGRRARRHRRPSTSCPPSPTPTATTSCSSAPPRRPEPRGRSRTGPDRPGPCRRQ